MPADPIVTTDLTSSGGELSPYTIRDPLLRAELYRAIRLAQESIALRDGEWGWYEIQPGDALSADLVAWKVYGLDTLKWVVLVAAGLDDSRGRLEEGLRIFLPPAVWIHERIQHYVSLEEQEKER